VPVKNLLKLNNLLGECCFCLEVGVPIHAAKMGFRLVYCDGNSNNILIFKKNAKQERPVPVRTPMGT
jgi:hypothetical protein